MHLIQDQENRSELRLLLPELLMHGHLIDSAHIYSKEIENQKNVLFFAIMSSVFDLTCRAPLHLYCQAMVILKILVDRIIRYLY